MKVSRIDVIGQNGPDGAAYEPRNDCAGCGMDMSKQGRYSCAIEAVNGYDLGYPAAVGCCAKVEK